MNYSAKAILHVYRQQKKEIAEALAKLKHTTCQQAYGNFYFQVNDLFNETGDEALKFKSVGYGRVCFLGNINDKVPTNGLYYRSLEIKHEIENLIRSLTAIFDNVQFSIKLIEDDHGRPNPQHAIIYQLS